MIFLSAVTKRPLDSFVYPFSIPTIKNLNTLKFTTPITYLVGENGTGKSTFIESLAQSVNLPVIGEKPLNQDPSLSSIKELSDCLKLSWKIKTHQGFFVRSEDVFGFTKYLRKTQLEIDHNVKTFNRKFTGYGQQLAVGSALGQKRSLENRYGSNLDANSHGETFLKVFQSRFVPGGLYLLDEPETPLSFNSQMTLLLMLRTMVEKDAQFIIATHSPILTALPEATIYSFDDQHIHLIKYSNIESFQLTKDFLNHPDAFLNRLK